MIARQVPCDLEDPRTLVPVGLIRTSHRAEERLLREILRGWSISKQPAEEPEDRLAVPGEEVIDLGAVHVCSC